MTSRAVVYTVDDNIDCNLQLVNSIRSVVKFEPQPYDIFILVNKTIPWITDLYGSRIVNIQEIIQKYGFDSTGIFWRGSKVPPMLLARLLIPIVEELKAYDQILYLDADTEVWDSSFFNIFDQSKESEIIAVKDSLNSRGTIRRISELSAKNPKDDPQVYTRWDDLIQVKTPYVNSGVLVFNMQNLRQGYETRLDYIQKRIVMLQPRYPDQDIINIYFKVHVITDRTYNIWKYDLPDIKLKHYVGSLRKRSNVYPPVSSGRPMTLSNGIKSNEKLGIFSGIVDHIYILSNSMYPDDFNRLKKWLDKNKITEYTQIDTRYTGKYDKLLDKVPVDKVQKEHMDNWMGHYKAVVDSIKDGYDKIAILEDTYDPQQLELYLKGINQDFDFVLLLGRGPFNYTNIYSAPSSKGYLLGKRGCVNLRMLFESLWNDNTKNRKLRYVHKWLNGDTLFKLRTFVRN